MESRVLSCRCMLKKSFYWVLRIGVLVIIFAIAISDGAAEFSTQPKDSTDIPHASAPTAVAPLVQLRPSGPSRPRRNITAGPITMTAEFDLWISMATVRPIL
jgi:hypothetical protein